MATVYRTIKANVFSPTTLYNIANNTASTAVHWADWYDDDTTVEEVCKYDIKAITTIMTAFQCNNSNGAYNGDIEIDLRALDINTLKDCRQDCLNALIELHDKRYRMREEYGDNNYELTDAEEQWDWEIELVSNLVDDINTEIDRVSRIVF